MINDVDALLFFTAKSTEKKRGKRNGQKLFKFNTIKIPIRTVPPPVPRPSRINKPDSIAVPPEPVSAIPMKPPPSNSDTVLVKLKPIYHLIRPDSLCTY